MLYKKVHWTIARYSEDQFAGTTFPASVLVKHLLACIYEI